MYSLGPVLLLFECLAFPDLKKWKFEHLKTFYTWNGSCVWIPCSYAMPGHGNGLENLTVYQNYTYDKEDKNFKGNILYQKTSGKKSSSQERVQFLGDFTSNCTLYIEPVEVQDSLLGLRVFSRDDKWMENIFLNISETAPLPRIELPSEIRELQEATLTCQLDFACPGYQIKWQGDQDGSPHNLSFVSVTTLTTKIVSTQSRLTFQPQWTDHGKNLTCQLWKDKADGPLSQEMVQLDVKYSPKLKITVATREANATTIEREPVTVIEPRETNVAEKDSVTMMCHIISSNPEYQTISWLKDGSPLREQKMLQKEQKTLTLTLSSVTKQMSGTYHCEAQNDIGFSKSPAAVLQVHYAPEPPIIQIDSSPTKEESRVTLTCISQAYPPATNYTWYHNGIEILKTTHKTFSIPKVSLKHAGSYSCLAVNNLGSGKGVQEAELDVQYSPKKVTMLIQNSVPIREGDNVTLLCNYNSSNPRVTKYEWKHQGSWKELMPGVLMIQKVAWNAGQFSCAACNHWCSWTTPIDLNVQYAPRDVKVLLIQPHSEVRSGYPVLLRCDFSSSHPNDVHFFWKKNGVFLEEGRDLSFDSISPEDAGAYKCLVNNSVGQSTSEAWKLQVLYAPRRLRVSISPKDGVIEGKKAVLMCESDANPPVSQYTWFDRNNQNLHHDDQMLRLDSVTVEHSGTYWCQAANRLGMNHSPPSTLTVHYSPETISKRVALGIGLCLAIVLLSLLGTKLHQNWKRIQSQQGLQENSSAQSFFVRNRKIRRSPASEGPHSEGSQSLGCYNPMMEDSISYATLRFPMAGTDTPRTGEARTPEAQRPSLNRDNAVTYAVVQKRHVNDYENVTPGVLEDEGIHYSELVHLGIGERPMTQEGVEYVTLKH